MFLNNIAQTWNLFIQKELEISCFLCKRKINCYVFLENTCASGPNNWLVKMGQFSAFEVDLHQFQEIPDNMILFREDALVNNICNLVCSKLFLRSLLSVSGDFRLTSFVSSSPSPSPNLYSKCIFKAFTFGKGIFDWHKLVLTLSSRTFYVPDDVTRDITRRSPLVSSLALLVLGKAWSLSYFSPS